MRVGNASVCVGSEYVCVESECVCVCVGLNMCVKGVNKGVHMCV